MKKKIKNYAPSLIAMGIVGVLYTLIFPLHRFQHYLIFIGVLLLVGWIVSVMAKGVDTSKPAPSQKPIPRTGNETVDQQIEMGQKLMGEIKEENTRIDDPALSAQIDQLGGIADRIFRTVAEQPKKAPQIRRFMDYYLPTTKKMLQGFRRMEEQQVEGQNADATKEQIRNAMDIILKAFDKQLDNLYQDDMLDISTDIDVLETLLKQDGLINTHKE